MEKLKVNKLIGEGLKDLLGRSRENYSFEFIINTHAGIKRGECSGWHGSKEWDALNDLTLSEMAQAIYVGYEIEETKEEQVVTVFQDNYVIACTTAKIQTQWHANGFNDGIKYMNNLFELGLLLEEKPFQ